MNCNDLRKINDLIIVRGGGDIASGTVARLHRCGYRVLILETEQPMAIRRSVAFADAVYDGRKTVEGVTAEKIDTVEQCRAVWERGNVPLLIDPACLVLNDVTPSVLVDAILAKRNCGTTRDMAALTIGLGPGFSAPEDVDVVIETARGHNLGRVIRQGCAAADTGVPGAIAGVAAERVIHAPCSGRLAIVRDISSAVKAGEQIATVDGETVATTIDGIVRGMIRNGFCVTKNMKIADIDPRPDEFDNCFTISDKARCISGSVLEAILSFQK